MNEGLSTMLWGYIVLLGIGVIPILLIALDFVFFVKKKEKLIFELIAFLIGSIYMGIAYLLWELPEYDEPLNIFGAANIHAPFNLDYLWALFLFSFWGFLSYIVLKYRRKSRHRSNMREEYWAN